MIEQRESLIREYYGRNVTPEEILFKNAVINPNADPLREALNALLRSRT